MCPRSFDATESTNTGAPSPAAGEEEARGWETGGDREIWVVEEGALGEAEYLAEVVDAMEADWPRLGEFVVVAEGPLTILARSPIPELGWTVRLVVGRVTIWFLVDAFPSLLSLVDSVRFFVEKAPPVPPAPSFSPSAGLTNVYDAINAANESALKALQEAQERVQKSYAGITPPGFESP